MISRSKLAKMIDHAVLKADVTEEDIKVNCSIAKKNNFAAIFVNSFWVELVASELQGSDVKVGATVGFPLGANATAVKVAEVMQAIDDGADEVDMVINIGALKSGNHDVVENDVRAVVNAVKGRSDARERGLLVKLIIETCYLNDAEKVKAAAIGASAEVDYIKTSTGFGPGGATVADIVLIKQAVQNKVNLKASGGIKSFAFAQQLIEAGVSRLGTSAGEDIINEMGREPI